ncbi:MAG: proton-conducting membrane transporter [Lachnospiraceae bacterium]|nr:proton-conducting membrane transporter [Lachnospiraceae bacterium]
MKILLLLILLLPIAAAAVVFLVRFPSRKGLLLFTGGALLAETALVTLLACLGNVSMTLFSMTDTLVVALETDAVARVFMLTAVWVFLPAGVFAFRYLEHSAGEGAFPEHRFYGFFLLSLAALMGMDLASNLVTLYFFFEMLTLLSMPLVLHDRTETAVAAALKYLFYSIAGALAGLFAILVLTHAAGTASFAPGGHADAFAASGNRGLLLAAVFVGIVGFGAKAGLYPLHGWLPTAHPAAPAPASAILSGVIAKAGVLAILRMIYFYAGPAFLSGTWVQTVLLILALLTVFMGSMTAWREKILKKRLAYSSVSQISYALFGLFLMNAQGLTGGLLQVVFHAAAKSCLFLAAGSFIFHTGKISVTDVKGLGRKLPVTFGAFTMAALSLIGIPPFAGFVSKWYLALGAMDTGLPVFGWLGPVVLLVSALLTAGYLLPVAVDAFFPGNTDRAADAPGGEGGALMALPLILLAAAVLVFGLFSGLLTPYFLDLASNVLAAG